MANSQRPASYEDLCALPEHVVGEIIDGELFASPRPALPHAHLSARMMTRIGDSFGDDPAGDDRPGGWWFLFEPELHFGADVLVPDLAGWRRERLPVVPNAPAITLAPDWVCELLSPSTSRLDRTLKLGVYAREGVAHAWLVDPIVQTVEVYERGPTGQWVMVGVFGGDDPVRAVPFDAVTFDPRRWWPPLEPAAGATA